MQQQPEQTQTLEQAIKNTESFTLRQWGQLIMNTADPDLKANITTHAVKLWQDGIIKEIGPCLVVDNPKRPGGLTQVHASKMPRKKNNAEGRGIMLHTLTHVENCAIDLSWDIAMRFDEDKYKLPKQFFDDWVRVAGEEAKHYKMVKERMINGYAKNYGDYPVHEGLWDDALKTKDDLLDRLTLEHCVHEGRGVDVTSLQTIQKFAEDPETQKILKEHILPDEITHVREGLVWFKHICKNILNMQTEEEIIAKFHERVPALLRCKNLIPPFDKESRLKAGMTEDYYMPLVKSS